MKASRRLSPGVSRRPPVAQEAPVDTSPLFAGDFSEWLRTTRQGLLTEKGSSVPCGDCAACCTSSYFIHIRPEETHCLERIPALLRVPAPGMPQGNVLLGYDRTGKCPMWISQKCSIYAWRPLTCRIYDCRIFVAADLNPGGYDKVRISRQVARWRFGYPTEADRLEHEAVKAAALFIRTHAAYFPGGEVPSNPNQLALLALKSYDVFMAHVGADARPYVDPRAIANAVVEDCRRFDAAMGATNS